MQTKQFARTYTRVVSSASFTGDCTPVETMVNISLNWQGTLVGRTMVNTSLSNVTLVLTMMANVRSFNCMPENSFNRS